MKRVLFFICMMAAACLAAGKKVQSRMGDIWLYKDKAEKETSCQLAFGEEASIVEIGKDQVLIKSRDRDCQGWAQKKQLEYVPQDGSSILYSTDAPALCCFGPCSFPSEEEVRASRFQFAEQVAALYKDSSFFAVVDSNNFFQEKFVSFRDSLYHFYMTHPEDSVGHRSFVERLMPFSHPRNMEIIRMEWDDVLKGILDSVNALYGYEIGRGDVLFDSLYQANYEQIHKSLGGLSPENRRLIQLVLARYERSLLKDDTERHELAERVRPLADSVARENKNVNPWHLAGIPERLGRVAYVKKYSFYFAHGFFNTHLFSDKRSLEGGLLGWEFYLGGTTRIGDFALYDGLAAGFKKDGSGTFILDAGLMYRPNLPFGHLWSIQPEFGGGGVFISDDIVPYYFGGIRYERAKKSGGTEEGPAGYLNGWSVGVSAKMIGTDLVGVKLDLRWTIRG